MKNIKITVEYDGTNYFGWQIQPNVPTIQGKIEKAIFDLTGRKRRLTVAAGQTAVSMPLTIFLTFLPAQASPRKNFSWL